MVCRCLFYNVCTVIKVVPNVLSDLFCKTSKVGNGAKAQYYLLGTTCTFTLCGVKFLYCMLPLTS